MKHKILVVFLVWISMLGLGKKEWPSRQSHTPVNRPSGLLGGNPGPGRDEVPVGSRGQVSRFFDDNQVVAPFPARTFRAQFFSLKLPGRVDYRALEDAGIDHIVVRVFQDDGYKGGLYFQNALFRTIDPVLEKMSVELKTKRPGIRLCAWMITRKFNWASRPRYFDYSYRENRLEMIPKFDLFNPEAIDKITAVFKALAGKDIDSILIQDDFFLRHNEGFSNWGKAAFTRATGLPARVKLMMEKGSPYNRKWIEIKRKQINKVLARIVAACKQVAPSIKVGMNVYYETPIYVDKAAAWYGHNLAEIAATDIDYIYLMSYHRQIKREMGLSESDNRLLFRRILERALAICGDKLIVKLQLRDWQTGKRIPAQEVKAYLAIVPRAVRRICFTPVKPGDGGYLKEITAGSPPAVSIPSR